MNGFEHFPFKHFEPKRNFCSHSIVDVHTNSPFTPDGTVLFDNNDSNKMMKTHMMILVVKSTFIVIFVVIVIVLVLVLVLVNMSWSLYGRRVAGSYSYDMIASKMCKRVTQKDLASVCLLWVIRAGRASSSILSFNIYEANKESTQIKSIKNYDYRDNYDYRIITTSFIGRKNYMPTNSATHLAR